MSGSETIDSVAILPFVNAGGNPDSEYLSDGITESLINSLSTLPHLKVMSRDSAFMYKGTETDARTVGQALGVRAVFKGRVLQRGDTLDISAELVDSRDNSHIWGQQYDRKLADIFGLRDEIAKEMTAALRMRLTGEDEKRMAKSYTANPEAYQDYLRGRFWLIRRNEEGFHKSVEYFQQAISKDPAYALAYSGLADSYSLPAIFGLAPPMEAFPRAKESALKALEIDDTLPEAHTSLGMIKTYYEWDWSGAEQEFQRAIALNPGSPEAHNFYSVLFWQMGHMQASIAERKKAVAIDPVSPVSNSFLGMTYYYARQYDQAIEQERRTFELDSNFTAARSGLGLIYIEKSMLKEGVAEFEKVLAISPDETTALSGLGYAYAMAGKRREAQQILDRISQLSKQKYFPAWSWAIIYAGLGEKDKAFEWLEKAYHERSIATGLSIIKVSPLFDSLRSDPRFADLLRRMNLQP